MHSNLIKTLLFTLLLNSNSVKSSIQDAKFLNERSSELDLDKKLLLIKRESMNNNQVDQVAKRRLKPFGDQDCKLNLNYSNRALQK